MFSASLRGRLPTHGRFAALTLGKIAVQFTQYNETSMRQIHVSRFGPFTYFSQSLLTHTTSSQV